MANGYVKMCESGRNFSLAFIHSIFAQWRECHKLFITLSLSLSLSLSLILDVSQQIIDDGKVWWRKNYSVLSENLRCIDSRVMRIILFEHLKSFEYLFSGQETVLCFSPLSEIFRRSWTHATESSQRQFFSMLSCRYVH